MKKLIAFFGGLLCFLTSIASHIIGGEVGYTFVRKTASNVYVYEVTVNLYRNCNSAATLPQNVSVRIHLAGNSTFLRPEALPRVSLSKLPTTTTASCTVIPVSTCYEMGTYKAEISLNENLSGYIISFNTCCRVTGLKNIFVNTNSTGATYSTGIPPHTGATQINSTPVSGDSVKVICRNFKSTFGFNFTDPDGDSLSYQFCSSYTNSADPPFPNVTYLNGYTGTSPLGGTPPLFVIDPATGIITGSSANDGEYAVTICVTEHRGGVPINVYRKEFQFRIDSCSITSLLPPLFQNCNDFTVSFNHNNDPTLKYKWDFGDTLTNSDTSILIKPTYTFSRPDSFNVKLVVTRGIGCVDSSITKVRVFPGFVTEFKIPDSPRCSTGNLVFADRTISSHGKVDQWRWKVEFPVASTGMITTAQNLTYNFPWPVSNTKLSEQAYIQLISTSSVGCADTTEKLVRIDRAPTLFAGPDLFLCMGDSVLVNAQSDGPNFIWLPANGLSSATVLKPIVSPGATTTYQVSSNYNGCIATDDVVVGVGALPRIDAGGDLVKCYDDTIHLSVSTTAATSVFNWSPSSDLINPKSNTPIAFPKQSTTYIVSVTDTGNCRRNITDTIVLRVVEKVDVYAGKDTFVQRGNPIQLKARGGQLYTWEPANLLVNPNSAFPIAPRLNQSTVFMVRGYTPEGCEDFDTVAVRILEIQPDIYVPTAFSPNRDGKNDVLKPVGLGAEYIELFIVFDRWGKQVYITKEYGAGWDGTFGGKAQSNGTYVWYIKARDYQGKKLEKKGTVVLMR